MTEASDYEYGPIGPLDKSCSHGLAHLVEKLQKTCGDHTSVDGVQCYLGGLQLSG
jgi:hypothetical protein